MNKLLPVKTRRLLPWGFLGMLALVGTVERSRFHANLAFATGLGHGWRATARQLEGVIRGREILCFGDSMVKYGLVPHVLREQAGRSAYNLALVGGPAPATYFLFRRALDAGARPTTILVDFSRELLQHEPGSRSQAFPWCELLTLREAVELCGAAHDAELFAAINLGRLLPSLASREGVRGYVLARLSGESPGWERAALQLHRNWTVNLGGTVNTKKTFEDFPAPLRPPGLKTAWRPNAANLHFVQRVLELAHERGIRVVWLLPPVSPGTQRLWERSGEEGQFEHLARTLLDQYPGLVVLDARHAGYEASVFHDPTHLDRDGAIALSSSVGGLLRESGFLSAADARWVALPPFRASATAAPVEDLGQSGVAVLQRLGAQEGKRR